MNVINQTTHNINPNFNDMLAYVQQTEKNAVNFSKQIKIRFLRNFTIEPIEPFLKFHLYKALIKPEITYSDYGSIREEILDPNSYLTQNAPEVIVLSLFYHMHDLFNHAHLKTVDDITQEIITLFELVKQKTQALVLINTFIPPFYSSLVTGSIEVEGIPKHYSDVNFYIREYVFKNTSRFIIMDWEKFVRISGENDSMDYRYWYLNKAPFKKTFLNLYAIDIANTVKSLKGHIKKCLILDCDNTLWGGIVGEDGISNIKLHDYDYPGKIFYDFQQTIIRLQSRGILIALCSKNNVEDVLEVLEQHPACLLKLQHLAAYRINWQDKATNIKELAEELNLGLDSFVFVDDNPAECELIKQFLPEITVLQTPKELFLLPQLLIKAGLFETLTLNEADKNRTLSYQQENARRAFAKKFINIEEYFASLNLKIKVHASEESEFSRIAQLTQKTNQFNLSLKRCSDAEIMKIAYNQNMSSWSLWVSDRFGDYGLTGVLIARKESTYLVIDSLLLSCRILSKRIEYAFVKHCMEILSHKWQIKHWYANYFPTERNRQVLDFLLTLGFHKCEETDNMHIYELHEMPRVPNLDFIEILSESIA